MKPYKENAKKVEKIIAKSDATFNADTFAKVRDALGAVIDMASLEGVNVILQRQHLRPLDLDDIARVAYVHARSITENDGGASPYSRIRAYCAKNGHDYNDIHIRAATEILLAVEFMAQKEDSNRGKHQCRTYSLSEDAKSVIFQKPKP